MDNIAIFSQECIDRGAQDPFLALFSLYRVGHYENNSTTCLWHWRVLEKETVVIYCEDGEGYIEDDRGFRSIKAGDLLIIAPGVPHRYGNVKGGFWTIGWAHVIGSKHDKMIGCRGEKQPIITKGSNALRDSLKRLPRIMSDENLSSLQLASFDFLHAVQDLNHSVQESSNHDDKILELKNFIEIHYAKNCSLDELSEKISLSKYQLINRFNKTLGVSPIEYVNQRKIYHATRFLSFTNDPIARISEKVGIQDAYYFSRLFKKIIGVSPRQYRKRGY
jgi:AraC family transcriptional regulator, arabinose operon regulatory protein